MNVTMQQAKEIRDKMSQIIYDFEHNSNLEPTGVASMHSMVPIEGGLIIDLMIGLHIVLLSY